MTDPAERDIDRVADCIRGYLAQHPAAADSEEGIAQWWLPAMGMDVPVERVRSALERLVVQGVVACAELRDGRRIYRAARRDGS